MNDAIAEHLLKNDPMATISRKQVEAGRKSLEPTLLPQLVTMKLPAIPSFSIIPHGSEVAVQLEANAYSFKFGLELVRDRTVYVRLTTETMNYLRIGVLNAVANATDALKRKRSAPIVVKGARVDRRRCTVYTTLANAKLDKQKRVQRRFASLEDSENKSATADLMNNVILGVLAEKEPAEVHGSP